VFVLSKNIHTPAASILLSAVQILLLYLFVFKQHLLLRIFKTQILMSWSVTPVGGNIFCCVYLSSDMSGSTSNRDRYLEQQRREKIETEVRDVDRIQITKVFACCPGWPSGGSYKSKQSNIYLYYSSPPAAPSL
jgi:hypothetical protein